jgi:glucuronoarabinoxylan endo-1,4-beta-xylanase
LAGRQLAACLALCACSQVDLGDAPRAASGATGGDAPSEQLGSGGSAGAPSVSTPGAGGSGGSEAAEPEPIEATLTVDVGQRFQIIEGFGASVAWYGDWLTTHPRKRELYELLFRELGLDILRLRNAYREIGGNFDPVAAELVSEATSSLGHAPRVLLTSWSPPARLKANGKTDCRGESTCTLKQENGSFVYSDFADYWLQALHAYAGLGVNPTWISIQNEPDFIPPSWEGCRLDATEGTYPSYQKALAAVRAGLERDQLRVGVLGPEVTGLKGDKVQSYAASLDLDLLDGIASHLYEGQSWRLPDSYLPEMRGVAAQMGAKPIFQTEFSIPGGAGAFETAWLIRNSLVELGASAYLYWDLIWTGEDGLISIEDPQQIGQWRTAKGYRIRDTYYSLKHFAAFTEPGDERVAAVSAEPAIAPVAFRSDDGRRLTVVALNTGQQSYRLRVDVPDASYSGGELYRTSAVERCQAVGSFIAGQSFTMPPRSIATVVLSSR